MARPNFVYLLLGVLASTFLVSLVRSEDPYKYFTWTVTYGTISPLGVPQKGILINGQFPGPQIDCDTNDNVLVNVINKLDEAFLITWNGIKQRRSSWQDGVGGTNCPIPPNTNWTYHFQTKDQIGSYNYFPSTLMHRASGGFGALNVNQRSVISAPYPKPDGDFTLLISDWYKAGHKALQQTLDSGIPLPVPDGLLINGLPKSSVFTGQEGKTYKFRISNVGITASINVRIQGHNMTLIEVEGSHTMQDSFESMDIHVGQTATFLVTLKGPPRDYYIVAQTRFTKPTLNATALLHYAGSNVPASPPPPSDPNFKIHLSMKQARTIRLNLTANAARPNPQGSYHYGTIPINRTLVIANSEAKINNKLRYAANGVSYVDPATPLKLADWFNIPGVFSLKTFPDKPQGSSGAAVLGASVVGLTLHDFAEIVFENAENTTQSWHMAGSSFYVVAFGAGSWTPAARDGYNLADAINRHTVQVYPKSWSAILVSLDNKGTWNLRSAIWGRRYLGQQLYLRVWDDVRSPYTESELPENALLCGLATKAP